MFAEGVSKGCARAAEEMTGFTLYSNRLRFRYSIYMLLLISRANGAKFLNPNQKITKLKTKGCPVEIWLSSIRSGYRYNTIENFFIFLLSDLESPFLLPLLLESILPLLPHILRIYDHNNCMLYESFRLQTASPLDIHNGDY